MRRPRFTVNSLSGSDVGQAPQAATDGLDRDQGPGAEQAGSRPAGLEVRLTAGRELGVLSIHFEGGRCRVSCPFCYLGRRSGTAGPTPLAAEPGPFEELLASAISELPYREVAVALSEPVEPVLPALYRLATLAKRRGKPAALTTTVAVAMALPTETLGLFQRLNLSIDPFKGQLHAPPGQVTAAEVAEVLTAVRQRAQLEHVLIVTLSAPRFAEQLWAGLLGELLALPSVDRVALNALKPPPPWCDRQFWMQALHRIRPLLREHLDRRLFLDCYVAARILGLGGCPARPDLSPAPAPADGEAPAYLQIGKRSGAPPATGVAEFRACVYQPAADFVIAPGDELTERLSGFTPPAACPFPIV